MAVMAKEMCPYLDNQYKERTRMAQKRTVRRFLIDSSERE